VRYALLTTSDDPKYHAVALSDRFKPKAALLNSLYSITTPWVLHATLWHVSQNFFHEADVSLKRIEPLSGSLSQSSKRTLRESHTMILSSEVGWRVREAHHKRRLVEDLSKRITLTRTPDKPDI
jgi:hypothetical protein